jgi:hypothetical protein
MKLVDVVSGKEILVGDMRETFRGERVRVNYVRAPEHAGSSGHVHVTFVDRAESPGKNWSQEVYPSVIGAKIALPNEPDHETRFNEQMDRKADHYDRKFKERDED